MQIGCYLPNEDATPNGVLEKADYKGPLFIDVNRGTCKTSHRHTHRGNYLKYKKLTMLVIRWVSNHR